MQCGEWDQSIRQCNTVAGDPNDALHRVTSRYNWITVHHAAARCPPLSPAPAVLRSQHRHGSEQGAGPGPGSIPTQPATLNLQSLSHILIIYSYQLDVFSWVGFLLPTLDIIDMVYIVQ